jgi:hypothetical protein
MGLRRHRRLKRETQETNKTVVVVVEIGSPFFSEAKRGTSLIGVLTPQS